jgi:hypothetical protein
LNKQVFLIFLRTWAWLLLLSLFPAVMYGFTESAWTGLKVFLLIGAISGAGLLWGSWGVLFPKPPEGE